jgi:hypothetical protein
MISGRVAVTPGSGRARGIARLGSGGVGRNGDFSGGDRG